jgi:pyrroline-5-carboxylate reductase
MFLSFQLYSGFRSAVIGAVKASTKRSMQLGGISDEEIRNKYNL